MWTPENALLKHGPACRAAPALGARHRSDRRSAGLCHHTLLSRDVVVCGYESRFRRGVQRANFRSSRSAIMIRGVGIVSNNRRHSYSIHADAAILTTPLEDELLA